MQQRRTPTTQNCPEEGGGGRGGRRGKRAARGAAGEGGAGRRGAGWGLKLQRGAAGGGGKGGDLSQSNLHANDEWKSCYKLAKSTSEQFWGKILAKYCQ